MKSNSRIIIIIIIALVVIFLFFSFKHTIKSSKEINKISPQDTLFFGLATGLGGLGDKAFNDMHFKGMMLAQKNYNIKFIYDSPLRIEDDIEVIENLIDKGANVIIAGGGYHMIAPVDTLSRKYPYINFIVMDDIALNYYDNVASIQFKQNEGSFLVGAFCALESKSQKIAMIGADDLNIINDFYVGFESGAKYINPKVKVFKEYITTYDKVNSAFANPKIARQIANNLYKNHDIDIIFQVAAGSGLGVFNAAKENGKYVIGVDSDQDYLAEGIVLTSMMKNIDIGLDLVIGEIIRKGFQNKAYKFGLNENGVGLSKMIYTKDMIKPETLDKLKEINNMISSGQIIVPSLFP
ncbi:MAG: BMP family ABC transporter substrate-binding protein [Candidatus Cloacimonetes bacterium]|nr:BMP family ABC transporter substrate-binding protein [Candidatus Cloacimonadota bacterium]MDD3501484.1 BMP family ABC transporter substrate-binding protein [Candidatus Cloacimonadota bacterium]